MGEDERAERRAKIKALGRKPPPSSSVIWEAHRLTRKNYAFPKIKSCLTRGCRTVVFGGSFCTLCSFMQTEPEIVTIHAQPERARFAPETEIDVAHAHRAKAAQEAHDLSNNRGLRMSPVGFAVVCLMIVLSLVAAYAQKHEGSRTSGQAFVAD